jgi:hypothetical protein
MDHGHPELAKSRSEAYNHIWDEACVAAANLQKLDRDQHVVIYDIGGARKGARCAEVVKDVLGRDRVGGANEYYPDLNLEKLAIHVSFPVVDAKDAERVTKFTKEGGYRRFQMGPFVKPPHGLTLCHHKLRDCDCFGPRSKVVFIAVHTLYYLGDADFAAVFGRFGQVDILAATHSPTRTQIPTTSPEFMWMTPTQVPEFYTTAQMWQLRIREWVYGEPAVAMVPLQGKGTVYKHDACVWLGYGGRHVSPITILLDEATRGRWFSVLYVTTVLMCLVGLVVQMRSWWHGPTPIFREQGRFELLVRGLNFALLNATRWSDTFFGETRTGWIQPVGSWWHAAALVFLVPVLTVMLRYCTMRSRAPGWLTELSVVANPLTTLVDRWGIQLTDIHSVTVGPPMELPETVRGGVRVEPEVMLTAVQMMLGVADTQQNDERVLAAVTRRYNYPLEVSAAALSEAKRRVALWRLSGNGSVTPPNTPPSSRWAFILSPLSVLGFLLRLCWRLAIALSYVAMACCVIACILEVGLWAVQ